MYQIETRDTGIMGTGSNMFRCGVAHSSGQIFVGTYGPAPAIIWRYDPGTSELTRVGAPGEYQLDCMVEGPNGKIYVGTAYEGLVYELDPSTGEVRNLGAPPVDSTQWIFTMICTRDGEIFGARGVGLFHLDWRTGKMESCGLVPGEHSTGDFGSAPIIRNLEERPDGIIWGDTNRWIFTLDPRTRDITPVADMLLVDDACYGIIHATGLSPVNDLYFHLYVRFSGRTARHQFFVCRAETGEIEPLNLEGLDGFAWVNGWWHDGNAPRLLITHYGGEGREPTIAVVDVDKEVVIDRWGIEGTSFPPAMIAGPGLWFVSGARGTLLHADPSSKQLEARAINPEPAECRCLAASPSGLLGTDTYDCGYAFTRPIEGGPFHDHGRVWLDDHRCNHGPAVFGGPNGEYFLANHSQYTTGVWMTELATNAHRRLGDAANQLIRTANGTVWGTEGPSVSTIDFDPDESWIPGWHCRPGRLFRWLPGAESVETFDTLDAVGPIAAWEASPAYLLIARSEKLSLYDAETLQAIQEQSLPSPVIALAGDAANQVVYGLLASGELFRALSANGETMIVESGFGRFESAERGFFVLPQSGCLLGLTNEGEISIFDPATKSVSQLTAPKPLPAGPAVHPTKDKWYFADREVMEYSLTAILTQA